MQGRSRFSRVLSEGVGVELDGVQELDRPQLHRHGEGTTRKRINQLWALKVLEEGRQEIDCVSVTTDMIGRAR